MEIDYSQVNDLNHDQLIDCKPKSIALDPKAIDIHPNCIDLDGQELKLANDLATVKDEFDRWKRGDKA